MADEVKKVLGLDAVSLIKADLLKEIKQESELITKEYRTAIENKANDILNNFETSSETDKQAILDQLTNLGQKDETLAEGVESLRSAIQSLNNKVDNIDQPESVLSDNDVKKIITASLIQKSFWSNDSMGSPTVAGNEIVGLVGTFGKIKTENLEGTLIEGKTVQSIPDSEGNIAWQLNNAGNGHLANGNISWNENGDVTFGEGVKIKWDNVDEKPEIPEGGLSDTEKEEIITTVIDRSGITAETITGRTIQSSEPISEEDTDPTWQITNNGTGYLAKKNIVWDETGKLTANIDGGSLGKQDENGKFPFEWDEDNVYVNKNFVFDEGVGITWDNISGTENIASKDDIPVLDDYATKEYVDQNSGGFTTEIGNNWIKTANVTCENLKVSKVDTKSNESGDKVTILGNTIQVLNDNDQPGLSISNNNINFKYSPELLKTSTSFESDDNGTEGYISIQKIYTSGSGEVLNGSGGETGPICEIGALNNTSMLSIKCAVRLTSGVQVSTSDYSITTKNTSSRPYIAIYKYNDSTAEWDYAGKISCTTWDKVTSINSQPTTGTSYMYRFTSSDYYFKFDRGIYALGLVLPSQSITFNSNFINKAVQARVDFNVYSIRRNLSSFVDIGKNGIVINSEKGNIYMDNSNIVMSMGTSESMYGIKITPNGMYYSNGGSTWTAWNPSN